MQILLVLAVLAAMLIAEACPHGPVSYAGARLLAALAAMALPAGFAALSARSVARRLRDDALPRPVLMRWLKLLRRLHALVWLAMAGLVIDAGLLLAARRQAQNAADAAVAAPDVWMCRPTS